jgi:hypothetical protein
MFRREFTANSVALVLDVNKRALARTEVSLGMAARDFLPSAALMGTVFDELFANSIFYPDGRAVEEKTLGELTTADPGAFQDVLIALSNSSGNDLAAPAPSPLNTNDGAISDLIPSPTGNLKAGKSKPRSRAKQAA